MKTDLYEQSLSLVYESSIRKFIGGIFQKPEVEKIVDAATVERIGILSKEQLLSGIRYINHFDNYSYTMRFDGKNTINVVKKLYPILYELVKKHGFDSNQLINIIKKQSNIDDYTRKALLALLSNDNRQWNYDNAIEYFFTYFMQRDSQYAKFIEQMREIGSINNMTNTQIQELMIKTIESENTNIFQHASKLYQHLNSPLSRANIAAHEAKLERARMLAERKEAMAKKYTFLDYELWVKDQKAKGFNVDNIEDNVARWRKTRSETPLTTNSVPTTTNSVPTGMTPQQAEFAERTAEAARKAAEVTAREAKEAEEVLRNAGTSISGSSRIGEMISNFFSKFQSSPWLISVGVLISTIILILIFMKRMGLSKKVKLR